MGYTAAHSDGDFLRLAFVHHGAVFRFAYRLAGDRAGAEDLTQQTYLEALKSFETYDRARPCLPWLYTILVRLASRSRRRQPILDWATPLRDDTLLVDPRTPAHLSIPDVVSAVNRLPEDLKITLLLAEVEGFSYSEIADILSIPSGTVGSRLTKAKRVLRQGLMEATLIRQKAKRASV